MLSYSKYFLLISIFSLQSCVVYNATKKSENICDIHRLRMNKSFVTTRYGRLCPNGLKENYINARSIQCMGCVIKGTRKYFAIKYSCKECTKLKKKDN